MSRSDPSQGSDHCACESPRDSFVVYDELPGELHILEEELLWLTDLVAVLLAHPLDEEPDHDRTQTRRRIHQGFD